MTNILIHIVYNIKKIRGIPPNQADVLVYVIQKYNESLWKLLRNTAYIYLVSCMCISNLNLSDDGEKELHLGRSFYIGTLLNK